MQGCTRVIIHYNPKTLTPSLLWRFESQIWTSPAERRCASYSPVAPSLTLPFACAHPNISKTRAAAQNSLSFSAKRGKDRPPSERAQRASEEGGLKMPMCGEKKVRSSSYRYIHPLGTTTLNISLKPHDSPIAQGRPLFAFSSNHPKVGPSPTPTVTDRCSPPSHRIATILGVTR